MKPDIEYDWAAHDAPSCEFGRKLMNNESTARYMRKKFGYKKRIPKPYKPEDEE